MALEEKHYGGPQNMPSPLEIGKICIVSEMIVLCNADLISDILDCPYEHFRNKEIH